MKPLLKVEELHVHFVESNGDNVYALNGTSFQIGGGEVVGVLGESGSGKSTLAKTLMRLLPKSARILQGSLQFEDKNLLDLTEVELSNVRGAQISYVSQDPGQVLNPVLKVGDQIAEVLRAHRDWNTTRRRAEVCSLLERVRLHNDDRKMYDAYPHQLSGGQQQRVVIAQTLACNPALIVADEPTASLDSETANEILELFHDLKKERKTSLLLITHDPTILPGLADRIAVMYGGRIVEDAPVDQIFDKPRHPYVRALLECVPSPHATRMGMPEMRLKTIAGSPPDAGRLMDGCTFSPRCSERLEKCMTQCPPSVEIEKISRVECFLYGG